MKFHTLSVLLLFIAVLGCAQIKRSHTLTVNWPAGNSQQGEIIFDLTNNKPLLKSISLGSQQITGGLDPAFLLTIGQRDLVSQNGWNIFFDKVPDKPYQTYPLTIQKDSSSVRSEGSRTIVTIGPISAEHFKGMLEITFFHGSPLFNIAAVMSTEEQAKAIVFDAGLVSRKPDWQRISWLNAGDALQQTQVIPHDTAHNPAMKDKAFAAELNTQDALQQTQVTPHDTAHNLAVKDKAFAAELNTQDALQQTQVIPNDTAHNLAVKYRAIAANGKQGTIMVFPPPHQYFYPLDEAFNLHFTWYGNQYRKLINGYGIGIRQDLKGDNRFVPWFNAPPGTAQRLNFFCLLSREHDEKAFTALKRFTHNDQYVQLPGFKTMSSHFHNEYIMKVVMAGQPVPPQPEFVQVFKHLGVDIVHLAEFHYTADPKGPDEKRLPQLKALYDLCEKQSDRQFLLLPGEEPNEFFGGHWLSFFPKPVYWVMSRKGDQPYVENNKDYGKVYHIGSKDEMLQLLKDEQGLAWTAHPRTKGSVNTPDSYHHTSFFLSNRFMGAAWKAMPADLSQPRLGKRVLDLMDDMNNWGVKKTVICEADLFTVTRENEMYAHMNVNYLMLDTLPAYKNGWQSVLDVMQQGKFFVSTGEVLIPLLKVNGHISGDSLQLPADGMATIDMQLSWTFPMNFVEIISGDGEQVYREKIRLTDTEAFGNRNFRFNAKLGGRKWVRVEAWDVAANGAFSQTFWLN